MHIYSTVFSLTPSPIWYAYIFITSPNCFTCIPHYIDHFRQKYVISYPALCGIPLFIGNETDQNSQDINVHKRPCANNWNFIIFHKWSWSFIAITNNHVYELSMIVRNQPSSICKGQINFKAICRLFKKKKINIYIIYFHLKWSMTCTRVWGSSQTIMIRPYRIIIVSVRLQPFIKNNKNVSNHKRLLTSREICAS